MKQNMEVPILIWFALAAVSVTSSSASVNDGYPSAQANGHVGKKSPSDYARIDSSPSCARESDYELSQNYIIRTKDSKKNGANFISAIMVRTFDVCLEQCCLEENCDTTIFVSDAYRSEEKNCFLFECRPEEENLCLFTYHLGYISSTLKPLEPVVPEDEVEDENLDLVAPDRGTTESSQIKLVETTKPTLPPKVELNEPENDCTRGYFQCDSGQCINELYICNTVIDCDDGSDEYRCSPNVQPGPEETDRTEDTGPAASEVVTVMALIPEEVISNVGQQAGNNDAVQINSSYVAEEGNAVDDTDQMVLESRGGSGMPPASSAILPLVIGLVITVCLLLMVGCRLRYMNQRLRYGRLKTSAHDADYLINGMYL